jgi:hypothetical protein
MNSKKMSVGSVVVAMLTFALVGCGGAASTQQASRVVGSAGATLKVGGAALSIPAGALSDDVQVTIREAEPRHAGRAARIEVEPGGLKLAKAGMLSVKIDDSNSRVRMLASDDVAEHLVEVEPEDRAHHAFKTSMSQLGAVEVEVEHMAACSTACAASEECDDGVCKPHVEDGAACADVCASGLECDDGACKAHGADDGAPGATPAPVACDPTCGAGLECDNGVCKPHAG